MPQLLPIKVLSHHLGRHLGHHLDRHFEILILFIFGDDYPP